MLGAAAGRHDQVRVQMNAPQRDQPGNKEVFLSKEDRQDIGKLLVLDVVFNDGVDSLDSGGPREWTQKDSSILQYVMAKAMYGTESPGSFWSNLFYGVVANQRVEGEKAPNFLNGIEDHEKSAEQRFSIDQPKDFSQMSVNDRADLFDHGIEPAHLSRLMRSIRHIDVSSVAGNGSGSETAGKA